MLGVSLDHRGTIDMPNRCSHRGCRGTASTVPSWLLLSLAFGALLLLLPGLALLVPACTLWTSRARTVAFWHAHCSLSQVPELGGSLAW